MLLSPPILQDKAILKVYQLMLGPPGDIINKSLHNINCTDDQMFDNPYHRE